MRVSTQLGVRVTPALKKSVKSECRKRGISIQSAVDQALKAWVELSKAQVAPQ